MDSKIAEFVSQTGQARPRGENKWYSPGRDISTLLPILTRSALQSWEDMDNSYRKLSDRCKYTDDDICNVALALSAFMSEEGIVDSTSFADAYTKSGLEALPIGARMLVFGMIGEEVLCAFWYAIRTATTKTDTDECDIIQYSPEVLAAQARRCARLFRLPKWKRGLVLRWWNFKSWLLERLDGQHGTDEVPGN